MQRLENEEEADGTPRAKGLKWGHARNVLETAKRPLVLEKRQCDLGVVGRR